MAMSRFPNMTLPFYIRNGSTKELIACNLNIKGELDPDGWSQLIELIPHLAKQNGADGADGDSDAKSKTH